MEPRCVISSYVCVKGVRYVCVKGVRLMHPFRGELSQQPHLIQRLRFIRPTQLTWKGHHASALTAAWCALILCRSRRLASCMHRMLSLPPLASCPPQCDHFSPQTSCVCYGARLRVRQPPQLIINTT